MTMKKSRPIPRPTNCAWNSLAAQVNKELAYDGATALFAVSGHHHLFGHPFRVALCGGHHRGNLHDVIIIPGFLRFSSGSFRCPCWRRCWRSWATR